MLTAGSGHSRVLVVEDDQKLAEALTVGIRAAGYEVDHAATGEEGFFLLHSQRPDLLILDLTLPHRSGLDVLRQVRQEQIDTRVLVLTSHNTVDDRVEGLNAGADDYLGKPFSFPELLARIQIARLRRKVDDPFPTKILHTIRGLGFSLREPQA